MSTKKRFSIAPELADGIRSTIQSAAKNQGQLHYDMMALEAIEPDPKNPRKLLISREEIVSGIIEANQHYPDKLKELEKLKELAGSIERLGIKNAIEVYKEGSKYRIISGERRYLAALLCTQKTVPVRIMQKPDEFNLRYTQWVENINRQDLSLSEKFNNLSYIAEAYEKVNKKNFTEKTLQELLGISNIQAYRYFCLLKADANILALVRSGKINNLKLIQELISMKDKIARNQIIKWIEMAKEEVTNLTRYKNVAGKPSATKANMPTAINLGKMNNINSAKYIIQVILADKKLEKYQNNFTSINWSCAKSVSLAFKKLFKALDKEFNVSESD